MNTTKTIIVGILCALVLVGGFIYTKKNTSQTKSEAQSSVSGPSNSEETDSTSSVATGNFDHKSVRDMWATWTGYLEAVKNHDIGALKEYAYALSDTCKDPKQEKACFDKMDAVYKIGASFTKNDFSTALEDGKQGILETKLAPINSEKDFGYRKSSIIFVKDNTGNPRLLSLKPNEEWKVKRNSASTTAELNKSLEDMVKDTDQDGLTDQIEKCIFPDNYAVISCVESNPNKRDSDGDGYWDGVGFLIPKK